MRSIGETLHGSPIDAAEIARVREVLMFEEPGLRERLIRFACLLILASAIATFGLIGDSVATVIGAMIVAPLMLPIMGLAFGISLGDRKAILGSIAVGLGGIATAIAVGYVLSLPWSHLSPEANTQIMSRTAPRLVDLCAALATGLAGAFGTARKDVSDTLPGVAIAISLVPPLANVGILLGQHRLDLAMGSMLLFVTNYLAILLAGSLMFGLMGFPNAALENQSRTARWTAIAIVALLALAIVVPLASQSYRVVSANLAETRTTEAAQVWLKGSGYRVVSAKADGTVQLVVAGSGRLPSPEALRTALRGRLFGMQLDLNAMPEQRSRLDTR
jgi:uncharacterized hydrophobic protein (TIGR00271 family)